MTDLLPESGEDMLHDAGELLDPLGDAEEGVVKNRAKVGSARPSSLLYTYGPGAIMDLPNFSIMPAGLGDWEPIWRRRDHIRSILEPRLLDVVRLHLGPQVDALRPFPWQPKRMGMNNEGSDLGIPSRVFPQWFRCTGCDYLGPLPRFHYMNTHPFRPDLAQFVHKNCPGRGGKSNKKSGSPAVPAQHLLTCTNGHLDEFPYVLWVHRGTKCPKAELPDLKLRDTNVGKSVGSIIACASCGQTRGMAEAQGSVGREKLPQTCRGRHPHLNAFDNRCDARPALIMMGASNLWFASTQSIIVMPRTEAEEKEALADKLRVELGVEQVKQFASQIEVIRALAGAKNIDLSGLDDADIATAIADVLAPADSEEVRQEKLAAWDPVDLLVPEWRYLQKPALFPQQQNSSGLMVTEMQRGPALQSKINRVVAVNQMKKVNAVLGFTRLDEMDRVNDLASRLVKLTRNGKPTWVPATEDRGEGIFVQLDLDAVQLWENAILTSSLWEAHRQAHRRNFARRFSETAKNIDPDVRLPAPRYWLLHTFSHALIREMAMSSGYGAASLTERIYGWSASAQREAAAGLLICTTASDSEGTLGGLVALSEPERLQRLVTAALRRASRCSSDPVCAMRMPSAPEDFLHGAACHCCSFASETSCEKANRFLDRRFLISLPSAISDTVPGFFGSVDAC
ncbi:DrmB family protein [Mycobacteroides abscessus subsp. abscessus]|uniref:DrmB family protein n=1 Tax=Mycobacteroides abscessus TaxID=36809 RepID=UPI0039F10E2B